MTELDGLSSPSVYQLRVVLRGVSPLVWRRLLVRSDSTVADLHALLQICFGWSDEHLHRFVIQGREYGVGHIGGPGFRDDPRRVRLEGLGLRLDERFVYEYDFYDSWLHDVRVEQIVALEAGRSYPRCVGGGRGGPLEDCDGVWAYLEWRQCHHHYVVVAQMLELLGDEDLFDQHRGEFLGLCRWLIRDRFDRRALNRRLAVPAGATNSSAVA
jgi:hypothetical protein